MKKIILLASLLMIAFSCVPVTEDYTEKEVMIIGITGTPIPTPETDPYTGFTATPTIPDPAYNGDNWDYKIVQGNIDDDYYYVYYYMVLSQEHDLYVRYDYYSKTHYYSDPVEYYDNPTLIRYRVYKYNSNYIQTGYDEYTLNESGYFDKLTTVFDIVYK